jgi:hypothetical protein
MRRFGNLNEPSPAELRAGHSDPTTLLRIAPPVNRNQLVRKLASNPWALRGRVRFSDVSGIKLVLSNSPYQPDPKFRAQL